MRDYEMVEKIREIVNSRAPKMDAAMKDLMTWVPDRYPLKKVSNVVNGSPDYYDDDDNKAPFFSEAFLYNLLGKEDARTLLAHIHDVIEAAGYDRHKSDW